MSIFPSHLTSTLDANENYHFEWFWRRTARKIPGAFFSETGNALFFQACTSDPAVTHGVLAMCSAHRGSDKLVVMEKPALIGREEDFALRQYNKAIRLLQPHLETEDTISLRVSLFSCLAFIWVELFRSHYQTAASHLEHGLRMLKHTQSLSKSDRFGGNLIDDWVSGVFRKLYVQSTLFGQRPKYPLPIPNHLKSLSRTRIFLDAHEAREYLENILLEVCALAETRFECLTGDAARAGPLRTSVCQIMNDLDSWMSAYDTTLVLLESQMDKVEAFSCRVLRMYHTMAEIMADTACETEETKYDRHTSNFLLIIQQVLEMRKIAINHKIREKYFGSEEGLPHSIGDMGPLAPLYYVATKCRIRRIRVHAIALLEEEPRKEGIHDANLIANIARKVIAVEDPKVQGPSDDFHLSDLPRVEDFSVGSAPCESRRVKILDIQLPNTPWDPAILRCRYAGSVVRYRVTAQPQTGVNSKADPSP